MRWASQDAGDKAMRLALAWLLAAANLIDWVECFLGGGVIRDANRKPRASDARGARGRSADGGAGHRTELVSMRTTLPDTALREEVSDVL
jgi:hypothetical protein